MIELPKDKKKDLEKILYKLERMPRDETAKALVYRTIEVMNKLTQKYVVDNFYIHRLERIEERYKK